MSASETDIERQIERHRPSLVGIGLAAVFAAIALLVLLSILAMNGTTPGESTTVVGEEEVAPSIVIQERSVDGAAEGVVVPE